jgi:hypothetical protein
MNAPSSQYRVPVREALCAFVRDSTTRRPVTLTTFLAALFPAAHDKTVGKGNDAPATEAALTVIRRRNPGRGSVNLAGANIPGAVLSMAHLEGVDFRKADGLTQAQISQTATGRNWRKPRPSCRTDGQEDRKTRASPPACFSRGVAGCRLAILLKTGGTPCPIR